MKKSTSFLYCVKFLLFATFTQSYGQFLQLPYQKSATSTEKNSSIHLKISEQPLTLPFWDDFSSGTLDNNKWVNKGAHVSMTVGNAAPSIGVLVLDGINEEGRPYSSVTQQEGLADEVASRPINLYTENKPSLQNVYISFFWQAGGKGELPDEDDFLSLQFLHSDGNWETVWQVNGGQEIQRLFFTQEILLVEPKFHHNAFQFRFQMRGKLSGPFDTWILDYVYLNEKRSKSDLTTEDRALSKLTTTPYKKYTSVPLIELKKNQEKYLNTIENEFKNLNNRFRAMDYSILIRDKNTKQKILTVNNRTAFNPVPLALERRSFKSNEIERIPLPEQESDYEILTYLSTGDALLTRIEGIDTLRFSNVDFRVNDTIKVDLPLRDYFAYDDGMTDYAAGINQRSGMLAVRYEVSSPAYLKGISINFTNTSQRGLPIDLMVWDDLSKEPLYVGTTEIPQDFAPDEFIYFEVDKNIPISGVFYVGFMQFTNNFIYIGLDKSNDTGEEIFYNVTGNWEQNEFVEGSLMIRPHLSEKAMIKGNQTNDLQISAYPNPVTEKLFLEGEFEIMGIYDSFGRKVNVPTAIVDNKKELNFTGFNKGIYLMTVNQNQSIKTLRVLVK